MTQQYNEAMSYTSTLHVARQQKAILCPYGTCENICRLSLKPAGLELHCNVVSKNCNFWKL